MTSMFVNEGGIAGHMSHLYDNPELTFGEIKQIFRAAAAGELEGTEKTDGQNLYISYSVKDGKAKAARNKGNIKQGGLDAAGLAAKFAGRGSVEEAFNDAFSVFEKAVQSLSPKQQVEIFGPDANIFYNAEVQDPRNANVINYDTKNLTIHRVGHAYFNRETGEVEDVDITENFETLRTALEEMQEAIHGDDFGFLINPIRTLDKLSDETLNKNLADLDKVMSDAGMSDNNTVYDYMAARIIPLIDENFPDLTKETKERIINRIILGEKSGLSSITALKKQTSPDQQAALSEFLKMADTSFRTRAIAPVEHVVHNFAVDALEGLQSVFVLDNSTEVARLKAEVVDAIKKIEASGREDAMEVLQVQLDKLHDADKVTTAAEGFVFNWDGNTYKFTGNFAPVNQILGMFKYGRGKIPALRDLTEGAKGKVADTAVVPGAFKPPHLGHIKMIKHYADLADVVKVYISKKALEPGDEKRSNPTDIKFTPEMSQKIFRLLADREGLDNVIFLIGEKPTPVAQSYYYIEELAEPGEKVLLGASKKDDDAALRFKSQENVQSHAKEGVVAVDPIEYASPVISDEEGLSYSATRLRQALKDNDTEALATFIPEDLIDDVLEILNTKNPEEEGNEDPTSESSLDEMSSGGGGTVSGPPGVRDDLPENYFIKREDLMKEMHLRETIRKVLSKAYFEKNKTRILEEQKLRKVIRKFITEAREADEVVYKNTGINKLRDLLRRIIPVIQDDYRDLTTSIEQRESFTKHLLIGIQNLLGISDLSKRAEKLPLQESIEEDIEVEIGKQADDPGVMDVGLGGEELVDTPEDVEEEEELSDEEKLVSGGEMPTDPNVLTGMRASARTLKKVQTQIKDMYEELSNPEDEKAFAEYILPNIKAHLDDFEAEISDTTPEPEVVSPEGSVEVEDEETVEDQFELSEEVLHSIANLA